MLRVSVLMSLPLPIVLLVLGFSVAVNDALADGASAPTVPPADSNPSSQTMAISPAVQSEKPIVLPEYEINGLRQRLDAREKILEKQDTQFWAGFMRLDNGVLIDNILLLCRYKAAHPNELVRLVLMQTGRPGRHDGMGNIVSSAKLDCFLVYTSGDELHARDVRYGDRVYPDFKAAQIRTLSDYMLFRATNDFLEITHGYEPPPNAGDPMRSNRKIHDHEIPGSVAGDDPNLQVRYAEAKLKEVGMTAFVVSATESTGPNNDLMLMFCANHVFYVWRPYWGAYRLSKDAYAQFGIKEIVQTTAR